MAIENNTDLISQKEAAEILGFKQTISISQYIKESILQTYEKKGSQTKWLDLEAVEILHQPLPAPSTQSLLPFAQSK